MSRGSRVEIQDMVFTGIIHMVRLSTNMKWEMLVVLFLKVRPYSVFRHISIHSEHEGQSIRTEDEKM